MASINDDEVIASINVTPLVDVVLVLLIFLMVAATTLTASAIPMDLPDATTGESTATIAVISIDKGGKLYLDGDAIKPPALRIAIKTLFARDKQSRVVIAADRKIPHGQVVDIVDLCRSQGISKIAINVRPFETDGD